MRQAASILQEFFRKSFRPQNARNSRVACVAQNAFTIRKRANPNRRRLHHLKRPGNPWRDNSASSSSAAKRRRSSPRRAEASPVGSGNGIIRARREQHANRAQVRSNAYSYRLPAYKLDTVDSSQFVTWSLALSLALTLALSLASLALSPCAAIKEARTAH